MGVYASENDEIISISEKYEMKIVFNSKKFIFDSIEKNIAKFKSLGEITFTENSDGSISFEYNGTTFTKQS